MLRPKMPRAKYSATPNLMDTEASRGAVKSRQKEPKRPPKQEALVEMDMARSG